MKRDVAIIAVGAALLGLVWIGWSRFEVWQQETYGGENVACTLDAKMCPDGSYVGRVGPKCEFATCPGE